MNWKTIIGAVVRHTLTTAGGALVAKGIVSADALPQLVEVAGGAVLTAGGVGWSLVNKKLQGLLHKR